MHPTGMLSCLQYKDITIIIIFVLSRLNSTTATSVAKASSKHHKVTLVEKIVLSATCVIENLHRGMINLTNALCVVRALGKKAFKARTSGHIQERNHSLAKRVEKHSP